MSDVTLVAFEGPDRYSFVGGLATRMNDLAEALVARGHLVRHVFVGDPTLPAREERLDGKLRLERWCQWISVYHPRDVYDGEDGKWRDFSRTVPPHLVDDVIAPLARAGRRAVLMFEDWQTADAAIATSLLASSRGIRGAATILWNANNTYGFGAIDLARLARHATVTTVSRFMREKLAAEGVDAGVIPNGIAERHLKTIPPSDVRTLRQSFRGRPTLVKVARFDPDKRWLWAIDAIAHLRDIGAKPRLLMRGSLSDHADDVGARIRLRGLSVDRIALGPEASPAALAEAIGETTADVLFLEFVLSERTLRALYASAEGVLANSEKEPFGLVGLEVMACGGIAYLGRTGEDYAIPFGNCVVVQTDDPRELATHLGTLRARPELTARLRTEGRATAKRYAWPRIIDALEIAWDAASRL